VQRCNATVKFFTADKPFFPPTINHEGLHEHFLNVTGDMLGIDKVKDLKPMKIFLNFIINCINTFFNFIINCIILKIIYTWPVFMDYYWMNALILAVSVVVKAMFTFFFPLNVLCYFCTYLNGLQFIGVETGKLR